jgi:hypothetical protein
VHHGPEQVGQACDGMPANALQGQKLDPLLDR